MKIWVYRPIRNVGYNASQPLDLNYLYSAKGLPYYFVVELMQLEAARKARKKAEIERRRAMGL